MNELAQPNQLKGRENLINVLSTSLYVGAKRTSIALVLDYCTAANLDPMQKPVHIVPMSTKDAQTGRYEMVDVIMPGVGLYRIQADRSGTMAGVSEPEFGPDITSTFKDKDKNDIDFTYPEWCRVCIKKIVGNHIVEFVSKEYWIENYATAGKWATAPNSMWKKRPKGQIAKCAEAQALRKAFPEIGSQPTAEEMEGKVIEGNIEEPIKEINQVKQIEDLPHYEQSAFDKNLSKWSELLLSGQRTPQEIINMISTKYSLSDGQIKQIKLIKEA